MKKLFLLLPVLVVSFCFGQENNKSLLWEISGNGLKKKSYLYGTMHVSDRVSYHLTDAFFKHLMEADIVATESDFEGWAYLDELLNKMTSNLTDDLWLDIFGGSKGGFYSDFRLQPLMRRDILTHFLGINYSTNNLLFRTSAQNQDYQEETYLDMFIYQVGKKLNKKTVGLEDAKEAFALIHNINYDDFEMPSEETVQMMLRLLRNRTPEEALSDFYREKDIELIYRFMELAMPEHWRNIFLYMRNEEMVKNIDSLARRGSLFASMGAGHLAGQRGAIELLREMGYTVTPVHDEYTDWGRAKKKEIDELIVNPEFRIHNTYDKMVSLPMFNILLHNEANTSSPDLANGGAINLKRTPLNDFVVEKTARFNHLSLDSLFFENIPGQIQSKEFVKENHLTYYDIKNTTRSGNTQRYRFYITPLELITVSMIGPNDYTRKFDDEVFSSITIKNPTETWETVTPARGGFSISLPGYHTIYGSKENPTHAEEIEIQAFDPTNNSFYFLLRKSPTDFIFEDSMYELERIQNEFYIQYDAEEYTITGKSGNMLTSESKIHGKNIYLKTISEGNFYYLAGCVDCDTRQQEELFSSFRLTPYIEDTDFRQYQDKNFMFSIDLPFRQNELLFMSNTPNERVKPLEKDEWFSSESKSYTFYSANGHKVDLFVYKYHPYQTEVSANSLFRRLNRRYLSSSAEKEEVEETADNQIADNDNDTLSQLLQMMEKEWENTTARNYFGALQAGPVVSWWEYELGIRNENPYYLSNHEEYYVAEGDYHVFKGYGRREGTLAQLRRMIVFKDGIRYTLETVVPENYNNDNTFVERLFGSFAPEDISLPYSVFENKLQLFLEHVQSTNDSIRSSALNSIKYLNFNKENLPDIHNILNVLEINNKDTENLKVLFEEIAAIDDPQIFEFVQDYYMQDNINTTLKISLLKGLAKQKNHQSYEMIAELLEQYLPIPERRNEIEGLFREFEKNPVYSSALFPQIFEHLIVDEYKNPILNFCKKLLKSDYLETEKLEPFKDLLLANANLEFRRTRSWVNNRKSQKQKTLGSDAVNATRNLKTYLHLIHPFIGEKRFADWWHNVRNLPIPETQVEMLNLELTRMAPDNDFNRKLLQKEETLFAATVLLSTKAPDLKLPDTPEPDIARSAVVLLDHVDLDNQELTFFVERTIRHNNKTIRFYFYNCRDKETPRGKIEETILMSIGFVLDDEEKIIPGAFFSGLQKPIKDPGKIDEYIFEVIDQSLNWNNKRATYQKNDFSANPFFGFDFF
jgi:uncharacterized protein YbaP (TraB family)